MHFGPVRVDGSSVPWPLALPCRGRQRLLSKCLCDVFHRIAACACACACACSFGTEAVRARSRGKGAEGDDEALLQLDPDLPRAVGCDEAASIRMLVFEC